MRFAVTDFMADFVLHLIRQLIAHYLSFLSTNGPDGDLNEVLSDSFAIDVLLTLLKYQNIADKY